MPILQKSPAFGTYAPTDLIHFIESNFGNQPLVSSFFGKYLDWFPPTRFLTVKLQKCPKNQVAVGFQNTQE